MPLQAAQAPAKINLSLHITGQRADGFHLLDSLVVFTDLHDGITAKPAASLRLTVGGPFQDGVPTDERNLILRAAEALRDARGVTKGASLHLTKFLPHAAGIGSASSDAASTLRLLAALWDVPPFNPSDPEVIALGGDVPACLAGPAPLRMSGIGEELASVPSLPEMALVLVNPGAHVPTGAVFAALAAKNNPAMGPMPAGTDLPGFCDWLSAQRNDMAEAATGIAPEIGDVLTTLRRHPNVLHAGMSGSGATCFGIVPTIAAARQVARVLQISQMGWWVAPASVIGEEKGLRVWTH